MHEPTYRQALKIGWQISWKHKNLWLFGLFAAIWGQFGITEILGKVLVASNQVTFIQAMQYIFWSIATGSLNFSFEQWLLLFWLLVMISVLVIGFISVATICQGAIIHLANEYSKKKKVIENPESSWHYGAKHFVRLLVLNFGKKIILGILAATVAFGAVNALIEPNVFDNILFLSLFVLVIFVGIIISFLSIYSAGYIVVDELSLKKSLESAWRLFMSHRLVSLEVGLIMVFFNIGLLLAILLGFYILFLPGAVFWSLSLWLNSSGLFSLGYFLSLLLFLLFLMVLSSFFTVFNISVWTYLFTKMHKEGIVSRLLHWVGHRK